jgi:hypothetical protein
MHIFRFCFLVVLQNFLGSAAEAQEDGCSKPSRENLFSCMEVCNLNHELGSVDQFICYDSLYRAAPSYLLGWHDLADDRIAIFSYVKEGGLICGDSLTPSFSEISLTCDTGEVEIFYGTCRPAQVAFRGVQERDPLLFDFVDIFSYNVREGDASPLPRVPVTDFVTWDGLLISITGEGVVPQSHYFDLGGAQELLLKHRKLCFP